MRDTITSDENVRIAFTLDHLPEHHRYLPHNREKRRQGPNAYRSRHTDFHAHTEPPDQTRCTGQTQIQRAVDELAKSDHPTRLSAQATPSTATSNTYSTDPITCKSTPLARLATHLITCLPTCPIPEIARLGRTLRKWKDAFLPLLRYSRSQQRTPSKPSTDIIERGRRTARGYPNHTNYQPQMLLIAGGLDASTHSQL